MEYQYIAMFFFRPHEINKKLHISAGEQLCHDSIFRMLARFSKYDFRVPGQILDFKNIFSKTIFYFSKSKKNIEKVRNLEKVGNFRKFKDFQWVSLVLLRKPIENP